MAVLSVVCLENHQISLTEPPNNIVFIIFFRPLAQIRRLKIVLSKVWLQRRLIGVKSVEEGDRISPLENYWQLLKQKGGFSGSPVINVAGCQFPGQAQPPSDSRYLLFLWQLVIIIIIL